MLKIVFLTFFCFQICSFIFCQNFKPKVVNPIDTTFQLQELEFDSVVAYTINFNCELGIIDRSQVECSLEEYRLNAKYSCYKKTLNKSQNIKLISFLTDTASYGRQYADCFEPRLILQFLSNKKEVFRVAICEGCGFLISTKVIPASHQKYYAFKTSNDKKEEVIYRRYLKGFSEKGQQRLTALCKELDMAYYRDKE